MLFPNFKKGISTGHFQEELTQKPAPSPYYKFINQMNRQDNHWFYWILYDDLFDGVTQNHVLFVVLGHPLFFLALVFFENNGCVMTSKAKRIT
jgi:hypothetical protein